MKHIAILKPKYYNMILSGEKSIESRFSMNKCNPYKKVKVQDEILIKKTGEAVTASAKVKHVKYYELSPDIVEEIRIKYGKQIGTDKIKDWESTFQKKYCTLIWLEDIKVINPIEVPRSNGAGWIILKEGE